MQDNNLQADRVQPHSAALSSLLAAQCSGVVLHEVVVVMLDIRQAYVCFFEVWLCCPVGRGLAERAGLLEVGRSLGRSVALTPKASSLNPEP